MAANTIDSHVERYKLKDSVGNLLIGCLGDKHILTADLRKAFYQNGGTLDLFDIELGEQVRIQPLHVKLPAGNLVGPAPYSPATNLIAFSTLEREEESWLARILGRFGIISRKGELLRYWVSHPDGSGLREIGHHSFNGEKNRAYLLKWSPNGKRLLITCHDRFYVVSVE